MSQIRSALFMETQPENVIPFAAPAPIAPPNEAIGAVLDELEGELRYDGAQEWAHQFTVTHPVLTEKPTFYLRPDELTPGILCARYLREFIASISGQAAV